MGVLSGRHGPWIIAWLVLSGLGGWLLAQAELNRLQEAFDTDARIAHRLLSQRVVQHDAILATLALLQPPGQDAAEQRLSSVYPQILGVQRRDGEAPWPGAALEAAEQESRQRRRAALAEVDLPRGRYQVVLAAQPASFALSIDFRSVVPWAEWPIPQDSPARLTLQHAGRSFLLQPGQAEEGQWRFGFRKALAAESQPFELVVTRSVSWTELPWPWMLAWAVAAALLLGGAAAWLRQRSQRQRAEELLRLGQVARLNTLGELAAGMAHELNQPLTAVLANTQAAVRVLDEDPPDLSTARYAMQQAVDQGRRAGEVVARLRRTVERPALDQPLQAVELQDAVRNALYLLEPEFARRGVRPQLESDGQPVLVRAEPVAVAQIIHNLVMNGLQALEQVPEASRALLVKLASGAGEGVLTVVDNGPGIPPDVLPRIFEPFFTTREDGLGLGLSLCESLADGMGGRLEAGAAAPHGAVFRLRLPMAAVE
jgi:signal transduction histidine kinase